MLILFRRQQKYILKKNSGMPLQDQRLHVQRPRGPWANELGDMEMDAFFVEKNLWQKLASRFKFRKEDFQMRRWIRLFMLVSWEISLSSWWAWVKFTFTWEFEGIENKWECCRPFSRRPSHLLALKTTPGSTSIPIPNRHWHPYIIPSRLYIPLYTDACVYIYIYYNNIIYMCVYP